MKEVVINIRTSSRTLDLIDRAAEIEGKNRSAFLRDCAAEAAKAVFSKPREIGEPCPLCGSLSTKAMTSCDQKEA
jgi:uncharacterized protein (DUF1778 family)